MHYFTMMSRKWWTSKWMNLRVLSRKLASWNGIIVKSLCLGILHSIWDISHVCFSFPFAHFSTTIWRCINLVVSWCQNDLFRSGLFYSSFSITLSIFRTSLTWHEATSLLWALLKKKWALNMLQLLLLFATYKWKYKFIVWSLRLWLW